MSIKPIPSAAPLPEREPEPEAPAAEHQCCDGCSAYVKPPVYDRTQADRLARAGIDPSRGACHLMPTPVAKLPLDWCRQWAPATVTRRKG